MDGPGRRRSVAFLLLTPLAGRSTRRPQPDAVRARIESRDFGAVRAQPVGPASPLPRRDSHIVAVFLVESQGDECRAVALADVGDIDAQRHDPLRGRGVIGALRRSQVREAST